MEKIVVVGLMFEYDEREEMFEEFFYWVDYEYVYMGNLGIEVVEVVIKFVCFVIGCLEIVVMINVFYGRIFGFFSVIWKKKYCEGFGFFVFGFKYIFFNNVEVVKEVIIKEIVVVIFEFI